MITLEQRSEAVDWIIHAIDNEALSLPMDAPEYTTLDWAMIFEAVPSRIREEAWNLIPDNERAAVLSELRHDVRRQTLESLSPKQLMALAANSSADEIIDFIDYLPQKIVRGILKRLSSLDKEQVTSALAYNDDQLGRYVKHDALVVLQDATLAEVIIDLRHLDDQLHSDSLYVVDEDDKLVGALDLHQLAMKSRKLAISEVMDRTVEPLVATLEPLDAATQLKGSDAYHLPVIDESGKLLGVFSHKDALSIIQQNFEQQLAHQGNVSDEDLFAPVMKSSRSRAVWLGINLATAFLAASVIGLFDQVIAEVVALAVLMPIVASMGGIAGSQTLTLTIRGLATGQLNSANTRDLNRKELAVSLLNGILWAATVGIACMLWFQSYSLALIIASAILANMVIAAFFGVLIPLLLDRFGIDPALAGSVILTTVTDVAGFFIFLGLAALFLIG